MTATWTGHERRSGEDRRQEPHYSDAKVTVVFLTEIVRDLIDDNPCRFDHHGYCQEHGWLREGKCPVERARDIGLRAREG